MQFFGNINIFIEYQKMLKNKKILIAGPWISELGWELMVWQAAVRYKRLNGHYDQTYVITFPGRDVLYETCHIFNHTFELKNASFSIGKVDSSIQSQLLNACIEKYNIHEPYDLFSPNALLTYYSRVMRKLFRKGLTFISYHSSIFPKQYDLIFHFRAFDKKGDINSKNSQKDKADSLVQFYLKQGLKIGCIGYPNYCYIAEGADNLQSVDLGKTIDIINKTHLVVGGSSAPMHLACLCECPIVLWTGPPFNAKRYLTYWNPFKSDVFIVTEKSFNPELNDIIKTINHALSMK